MLKEDPSSPLVRAIADEVLGRIMELLVPLLSRPPARLLTVEEAGVYLGRTAGAIRNMQKAGKLPVVKIDERVLFDVRDLDRVIEAAKNS